MEPVANNSHHEWYQLGVGSRLIEAESNELSDLLSKLCGYHLVFLGDPGLASLVKMSLISHRILVNPEIRTQLDSLSSLQGDIDALPLRSDSVDVVVLSHTLEHSANPHEILREAHRILIPEGHVVITGFNPFSLWGIWHAFQQFREKTPQSGKMLGINRTRDWLKLLNFQITGGRMFYFRPPIERENIDQKLRFLENWGQNCWPFLGGAYTILAVKRVVPLTPVRARWKAEQPIWQDAAQGLPKPTTTTVEK